MKTIEKKRGIIAFFGLVVIGLAAVTISFASPAKSVSIQKKGVRVCHYGQNIRIDKSAIPAHLAHGDVIGGCAQSAPRPIEF